MESAGINAGLESGPAIFLKGVIMKRIILIAIIIPLVFLGVTAFLVVIAQLACFVPARLASRADPVAALRVK